MYTDLTHEQSVFTDSPLDVSQVHMVTSPSRGGLFVRYEPKDGAGVNANFSGTSQAIAELHTQCHKCPRVLAIELT